MNISTTNGTSPVDQTADLPQPTQALEADPNQAATEQERIDQGRAWRTYHDLVVALMARHYASLALVDFLRVYGASLVARNFTGKSTVRARNEIRRLDTFRFYCPEVMQLTPVSLIDHDGVWIACLSVLDGRVPGSFGLLPDRGTNRYLGALGRLLKYVSRPPWSLIPPERLKKMQGVIAEFRLDERPRVTLTPNYLKE